MADVKNIITLGIGASPGKIMWFITVGLEPAAEEALTGIVALTIQARNLATTTGARIATTTGRRAVDLTIKDR